MRISPDAYRRLIQMFGRTVLHIPGEKFEALLTEWKQRRGVRGDHELTAEDLAQLVDEFKRVIKAKQGTHFPEDPAEQWRRAVEAVSDSWFGKRATDYRNFYGIPHDLGTAVNFQAMVFGNRGQESGTGVAFTRNPATGEKRLFGEYLVNAQGEDVVASIRTPSPSKS